MKQVMRQKIGLTLQRELQWILIYQGKQKAVEVLRTRTGSCMGYAIETIEQLGREIQPGAVSC